jgi:surface antigen
MKLFRFATSVLLALGLAVSSSLSASAAANVTVCEEASYYCVNTGVSGVTGYSGSDGSSSYNYDKDSQGNPIPHNCTSYVAYRFFKVMGYADLKYGQLGDASQWDTTAITKIPGAVLYPQPYKGDIAQWNYGHVAWIDYVKYTAAGNVDYIVVSEDTFNLGVTRQRRLYKSNLSAWPDNFIGLPIYGGGGGGHMVAMSMPVLP